MESDVMRLERAVLCAQMIDDEGRRAVEVARAKAELAATRRRMRMRARLQAEAIEINSRAMVATLAASWGRRDLAAPALITFDWHVRCPLALAVLCGALALVGGLGVACGSAHGTFELTALGRLLVRRYRHQTRDVA